jgi:hypothetical protein
MAPTTTAGPSKATIDSLVSGLAAQPPVSLTYQEVIAAAMFEGISDQEATILAAISSVETSRNAIAVSGRNLSGSRSWGAFAVTLPDSEVNDGGWMVPTTNAGQAKTQLGTGGGLNSWKSYASGAYLAAMPQAQMAAAQVTAQIRGGANGWPATQAAADAQLQSIALPNDLRSQIGGLALEWQAGSILVPTAGGGVDAIGQLGAAAATATNQTVFAPFKSVLDFLNALGNPATWARIAYALIGGALIVVALRQVAAGQ